MWVNIAFLKMGCGGGDLLPAFPLIVPEALMIEPTETESKETLDAFADALSYRLARVWNPAMAPALRITATSGI